MDEETGTNSSNTFIKKSTPSAKFVTRKVLFLSVVIILFLIVSLFVLQFVLYLEVKRDLRLTNLTKRNEVGSISEHSVSTARAAAQYREKRGDEQKTLLESIEVSGYGFRTVNAREGKAIGNWRLSSKTGNCSLVSLKYIAVGKAGLYKVYSQVWLDRSNTDETIGFKIMKNRHEILMKTSFDSCKTHCSKFTSRLVQLKKGDYISIQATEGTKLYMSPKTTFFGIKQMA